MLILVSSRREHQNCCEQIRPEFSQTKFLQAGVQVKENFFSGKTMSNTSYYLSTLFIAKFHTWLHLSTQYFCFVPDSISLSYLVTSQLSIRFCTEQDKIAQAGPRAPAVNFFALLSMTQILFSEKTIDSNFTCSVWIALLMIQCQYLPQIIRRHKS